jgi:ribonuclease HI
LGQSTNNQAETLGLLKDCQLAQGNGEKDIQLFGDSEILIKILNTDDYFNNPVLNKTLQRLRKVMQNFTSISFYHILQNLNNEVDERANMGCLLAQEELSKNTEIPVWYPIP